MHGLPSYGEDKLSNDFSGPLATGEKLIAMQCLYSRYAVVETIASTSAKATISAMDRVLSLFGIPSEITSDNEPPYDSEHFKNYAKHMGFKNAPKIPCTPWVNGTPENFMKTLEKLMQTASEEHLTWREELHKFLRAYRAIPHPMTGQAPATKLFSGWYYKTHFPTPTKKTILVSEKEVREQDKK